MTTMMNESRSEKLTPASSGGLGPNQHRSEVGGADNPETLHVIPVASKRAVGDGVTAKSRRVAFETEQTRLACMSLLSWLDAQPACNPVNASPTPLRVPAHDSGPWWFATPSMQASFILFFPPVLTGAPASKSNSWPRSRPPIHLSRQLPSSLT